MHSLLFLENTRNLIWRLFPPVIFSQACIAFSKAFDNSEQSSVSLRVSESGNFASTVNIIPDCFALEAKEDKIRFTVSFSQKRMGVMASMSDWTARKYSLILSICLLETSPCKRAIW